MRAFDAVRLQRHAQRELAQHAAAPQRYGTAFHVTAPYPDVREMPVEEFMQSSRAGPVTDLAPPPAVPLVRRRGTPSPHHPLTYFIHTEPHDPYLLWHLSHLDVLPMHTLTVPAGETRELTLTPRHTHVSNVLLITLEEDSALTLYDTAQAHEILLQRIVVVQHAQSHFTYWGVRGKNMFSNEKVTVQLAGAEAATNVTHLMVGAQAEQSDSAVTVRHEGELTASDIAVRSLAADKARTVYRGLIDVATTARGARGYQQGRALVASRQAVVDMLPQLEIATNDVRCSHGVTTTHLSDEALFYLRSRGLGAQEARRLAIRGFFHQQWEMPTQLGQQLDNLLKEIA